jgi:N-methylhydantoinase A
MHVVNLRLVATLPSERPSSKRVSTKEKPEIVTQAPQGMRSAYWGKEHGFLDTPVLGLEQIGQSSVKGPLLVDCYDTTIVVPPDCTLCMGEWGNITIHIET